MRRLKAMGFSDKRLAFLALKSANLPAKGTDAEWRSRRG